MGRVGRIVCVGLPVLLTLGALINLIVVFVGNTSDSSAVSSLYFAKFDTSAIAAEASLYQWYTVGLFNYCAGSADSVVPDYCSPHTTSYVFNPLQVWGGEGSQFDNALMHKMLDNYEILAKYGFIAYCVALGLTVGTLALCVLAFFSRLGSVLCTVTACVATLFNLSAAGSVISWSLMLLGVVNEEFQAYGVKSYVGGGMYSAACISFTLSAVASVFWLFSSCCCGAKKRNARNDADGQYGWGQEFGYGPKGGFEASERELPYGHYSGDA